MKIEPFNGDTYLEDEFLKIRDRYHIRHVIETGSYHGHTTRWLGMNFDNVTTIESNTEYLTITSNTVHGLGNVRVKPGDSSVYLIKTLQEYKDRMTQEHAYERMAIGEVKDKLLLFLDAHWYKNPVLKELEQIALSGLHPFLVIHDFKNPNDPTMGYDIYPNEKIVYEFKWIKDHLDRIYGEDGYEYYYNDKATGARRGCLFIIPKHRYH
jgi:hypothetical protein